jgi:hypothetical protein
MLTKMALSQAILPTPMAPSLTNLKPDQPASAINRHEKDNR